jgi:hypothetical protein
MSGKGVPQASCRDVIETQSRHFLVGAVELNLR